MQYYETLGRVDADGLHVFHWLVYVFNMFNLSFSCSCRKQIRVNKVVILIKKSGVILLLQASGNQAYIS